MKVIESWKTTHRSRTGHRLALWVLTTAIACALAPGARAAEMRTQREMVEARAARAGAPPAPGGTHRSGSRLAVAAGHRDVPRVARASRPRAAPCRAP